MKVFLFYRLNEGVTPEEYREWSLSRDQPTLKGCEGIADYRVFEVVDPDGKTNYSVMEYVDVADWDTWKTVTSTGPMVPIGEDFQRLVDVDSVVTLRGEEIIPSE
jgi:hypothetical protein